MPGGTIVAVMADLFFLVQVNDIAKKLGFKVESAKDAAALAEKLKSKPVAVIFDLNYAAADPVDLIRGLKTDPETKALPAIAFVSHVQTDLIQNARDNGCDVVLARSAFARELPGMLRNLTADQG